MADIKSINSPNFNPLQSAYCKCHSTETAHLKMVNDIHEAMDTGRSTIIIALDMSAAFDTIDQAVLLNRLKHTFGVTGTALEWISSYLSHRQSYVRWGTGQSVTTTVEVSIPQGSVLGPMLFTLFIASLAKVTESFDIQHHQ